MSKSITLFIQNARLSFDKNLFVANEKDKRSCNIIAQPESKLFRLEGGKKTPVDRKGLDEIIQEVLKTRFTKVPAKFENWAVRENTTANNQQSGDRFVGYEDDNGFYFAPSRYEKNGPPAFLRRDGTLMNMRIPAEAEEAMLMFYGGCYCDFKINIAAYETKEDNVTKRGVTTFLEGLQFRKAGDRFGASAANGEGFEALPEDEEDDGLGG